MFGISLSYAQTNVNEFPSVKEVLRYKDSVIILQDSVITLQKEKLEQKEIIISLLTHPMDEDAVSGEEVMKYQNKKELGSSWVSVALTLLVDFVVLVIAYRVCCRNHGRNSKKLF
ncbi:MAG: hypothetical protein GXP45_00510 [bacterium]|nr:hypothetical protein [bacterium]